MADPAQQYQLYKDWQTVYFELDLGYPTTADGRPDLTQPRMPFNEWLGTQVVQSDGTLPLINSPEARQIHGFLDPGWVRQNTSYDSFQPVVLGQGDQVLESWGDLYNYLPYMGVEGGRGPATVEEFITQYHTDPVTGEETRFDLGGVAGGTGGGPQVPEPPVPGLPTSFGGGGSIGGAGQTRLVRPGGTTGGGFNFNMDINFGPVAIPNLTGTLGDLFQGREALTSTNINLLQRYGGQGVDRVRTAVPELGAAAAAAQGAFGADIGSSFDAALQEAAAARGVDVGQVASFDAQLASEALQDKAVNLASRTGFEDLMFGGFVPPQNLNFGTLGSLSIQQAQLQSEIQAGVAQSLQAQNMFAMMLPGLLDANDPLKR